MTLPARGTGINIVNEMFNIFFRNDGGLEKPVKKIILFAEKYPSQAVLGRQDLFELPDLGRR